MRGEKDRIKKTYSIYMRSKFNNVRVFDLVFVLEREWLTIHVQNITLLVIALREKPNNSYLELPFMSAHLFHSLHYKSDMEWQY